MTNAEIAAAMQKGLELAWPAVGLAFVSEPPERLPMAEEGAPSGCRYWRQAEEKVFFASGPAHFACPVGAHVMGFPLPPSVAAGLTGLVETMAAAGYFDPAEAAQIPTVPPGHAGIVYGPLARLPGPPSLVLCWVDARQAMLVGEAVGTNTWVTGTGTRALGRPGCAALPQALREGRATVSFGCAGMRVYTGVPDGVMLCALPLAEAEKLAAELPRVRQANEAIAAFHAGRNAAASAAPAAR